MKVTYEDAPTKFKVETSDDHIEADYCKGFNVIFYGVGDNSNLSDEINFSSIEKADIYLKMMRRALREIIKKKEGK